MCVCRYISDIVLLNWHDHWCWCAANPSPSQRYFSPQDQNLLHNANALCCRSRWWGWTVGKRWGLTVHGIVIWVIKLVFILFPTPEVHEDSYQCQVAIKYLPPVIRDVPLAYINFSSHYLFICLSRFSQCVTYLCVNFGKVLFFTLRHNTHMTVDIPLWRARIDMPYRRNVPWYLDANTRLLVSLCFWKCPVYHFWTHAHLVDHRAHSDNMELAAGRSVQCKRMACQLHNIRSRECWTDIASITDVRKWHQCDWRSPPKSVSTIFDNASHWPCALYRDGVFATGLAGSVVAVGSAVVLTNELSRSILLGCRKSPSASATLTPVRSHSQHARNHSSAVKRTCPCLELLHLLCV